MKYITILFLLIAFNSNAQDTTRTPIGYTIDLPHLYVLVDTINKMAQVHSYYPHKMFISINGGKASVIQKRQVLTVWSNHFTVTVTRKKYKHLYQF